MQDQRYNYKNITNKQQVLQRYPQEYIVGNLFILIDLFCGPIALLIDMHFIISNQIFTSIYLSDVFRMLKIFSLTKIRILIKDIFHVVPLASDIFAAMVFVYYIFSFQGFVIFHNIHPDYFGNLFISMLSMFQVTTFDSWNYQVQQPILEQYGYIFSLFFIGFIFISVYFFFNFFLSAFVTYYGTSEYRVNYLYDIAYDQNLNKELKQKLKNQVTIRQILYNVNFGYEAQKLQKDAFYYFLEYYKYFFWILQILTQLVFLFYPQQDFSLYVLNISEIIFGLCICFELVHVITKNLKRKNKQWVQMSTLFISGVIGFLLDIYVVKQQGINVMIYGGMLRNMVLLVTPQCIFSFSKLFTVIKEVGPLTILNVLTLFILAIIGYVGLHGFDKEWNLYFENLIQTFLFLLQVITFDTWGDIARSAIQTNKMWAIYFVIVVVFVGFFLQNLMIGQIATIVQPSTAKKFHKNYILDKKVPQEYAEALNKLNQQEKRKQENQQYNLQDAKNLLEKFKKSSNGQTLQIFIDNQVFEITSKDLINIK